MKKRQACVVHKDAMVEWWSDASKPRGTATHLATNQTLACFDSIGAPVARQNEGAPSLRSSLFGDVTYNSAGIPITAGVLYPFFGLLLSPIIAAAAMSLSSISVVSNALRLRRANV